MIVARALLAMAMHSYVRRAWRRFGQGLRWQWQLLALKEGTR